MRHTCPGGGWKGRKLNEIMKPMCLWRKNTLIWKIKTEHTEMPGDLFQFKNKEHYAFVGTANRWKPPSTSQSVQAWAKSCPFQCFPLYSCALALDHGVVCLRNCWPTKAINVYDETVSVMIESPHLDISNKNSKKTKLLYVGLCLCVSFMHKSYVYTSLIIYKIIYDLC